MISVNSCTISEVSAVCTGAEQPPVRSVLLAHSSSPTPLVFHPHSRDAEVLFSDEHGLKRKSSVRLGLDVEV